MYSDTEMTRNVGIVSIIIRVFALLFPDVFPSPQHTGRGREGNGYIGEVLLTKPTLPFKTIRYIYVDISEVDYNGDGRSQLAVEKR